MTAPFTIDGQSPTPIYDQIVTRMSHAIAAGSFAPGEALPSVRQLAMDLRVNPNTVARAYRELEAQGLVETQQGRGTFVSRSARARPVAERRGALAPRIDQLVSEARLLGVSPDELVTLVREAARKLDKGGSR